MTAERLESDSNTRSCKLYVDLLRTTEQPVIGYCKVRFTVHIIFDNTDIDLKIIFFWIYYHWSMISSLGVSLLMQYHNVLACFEGM